MAIEASPKPPRKYWIGVALSAAFVLFGLVATLGIISRAPAENVALLGFTPDLPFWLLLGAAILGEVIGVLGLLRRRTWATTGFAFSVLYTVMYYMYVLHKGGWRGPLVGPAVITAVHALVLWFSIASGRRGWTHRGV